MARRSAHELVDRHLKLFAEDWKFLLEYCGQGDVGLTAGEVARAIIHQKVKWLRAAMVAKIDELAPGEALANKEIGRILRDGGGEAEKVKESADELGF